jgi:hypothetical protein
MRKIWRVKGVKIKKPKMVIRGKKISVEKKNEKSAEYDASLFQILYYFNVKKDVPVDLNVAQNYA